MLTLVAEGCNWWSRESKRGTGLTAAKALDHVSLLVDWLLVVPGQTRLDEGQAEVLAFDHDASHRPTVTVNVTRLDADRLAKDLRRGELFRSRAEVLGVLGTVDALNANSRRSPLVHHGNGVAIGYAHDLRGKAVLGCSDSRKSAQK